MFDVEFDYINIDIVERKYFNDVKYVNFDNLYLSLYFFDKENKMHVDRYSVNDIDSITIERKF